MFRPPDAEEALPSRATVGRPGATLQTPRPRLVASLLSVRNWQQLGKFCVVGAVGYLINLAVYDLLLHRPSDDAGLALALGLTALPAGTIGWWGLRRRLLAIGTPSATPPVPAVPA